MKYLSPFNPRYGISPFSSGSFSTTEKEIEKLFGNLPSLDHGGGEWLAGSDSKSLNPIWFEHDEAYVVQVELPGVESKNVTLEVVSNILKLSAEHETRSEKQGMEGSLSYSQSLSIPDGVDSDKISAEYKDGVLSVSFPKTEAVKPRRIDVN